MLQIMYTPAPAYTPHAPGRVARGCMNYVNCDAWADRRAPDPRGSTRRTRGDGGGGIDAAAPAGFIDVRKASSLPLLKAVISACIDTLLYGGGMVSSSQVDAQRQ